MSDELIKYDAACKAIAEAKRVDEVKHIRDVSIAIRAYARQANNHDLERDAIEIRMRATRRMDQMREKQKDTIGLARGGGDKRSKHRGKRNPTDPPTLAEAGIDKNLAKEGRKLGVMSEQEFEKAVSAARDAVGRVVKDALRTESKKEHRAERERELGTKQRALPHGRYGVILADPEWRFEPWSRETGMDRAADNHYPTSCTEVIAARDVPSIAADDCVLFLWATAPMLPHALLVMAAWGFDYKTHFIWFKDREGTGYWNRNRHELLLVGTRGNVPAPAPGTQSPSVYSEPGGEHSAKPEYFLLMIEKHFPNLPKIELNRRGPARPGWDAWGNEAGDAAVEAKQPADATLPPAPGLADDGLGVPEFLRRVPQSEIAP
jgi:N6-adenosine-specific RNA methylase IME4